MNNIGRYELHLKTTFESLKNTLHCTNLLGLFALYVNTNVNRDVHEMFKHMCCKYQWLICDGKGLAEYRSELIQRLGQELECLNLKWWKLERQTNSVDELDLIECSHLHLKSFQADDENDARNYAVKVFGVDDSKITTV